MGGRDKKGGGVKSPQPRSMLAELLKRRVYILIYTNDDKYLI